MNTCIASFHLSHKTVRVVVWFEMIRCVSVSLLLVASFPRGVYVQDLSVSSLNAITELYNSCTCLTQSQCNDNEETSTPDPSSFIERRTNVPVNRIQCRSESPSEELYCCKQPKRSTTTTVKPDGPDTKTQNAILELFNNCTCVPENQCEEDKTSNTSDISSIIERRTGAKTDRIRCQSDSSTILYCCKGTGKTQRKPTVIEKAPNEMKCGTGISSLEPRILASVDTEEPGDGEFPWMVAIFNKTAGNYHFRCGGALIHPKVVLTAMHCVYRDSPSNLAVAANGKAQLPNQADGERRGISEIIKHPRYTHFGRLYNDAALLILDKPFAIAGDNGLNTLCLPSSGVDLQDLSCYIAGWGTNVNGERDQYMKKVELPFVDRTKCQTLLRRTRLGQRFKLHSSFLCAGGEEGKDACIGDGGGPLMCLRSSGEERYFQAGIVSWGIGCGQEDVPGVYTDVEKITEWIKEALKQRNLNI